MEEIHQKTISRSHLAYTLSQSSIEDSPAGSQITPLDAEKPTNRYIDYEAVENSQASSSLSEEESEHGIDIQYSTCSGTNTPGSSSHLGIPLDHTFYSSPECIESQRKLTLDEQRKMRRRARVIASDSESEREQNIYPSSQRRIVLPDSDSEYDTEPDEDDAVSDCITIILPLNIT